MERSLIWLTEVEVWRSWKKRDTITKKYKSNIFKVAVLNVSSHLWAVSVKHFNIIDLCQLKTQSASTQTHSRRQSPLEPLRPLTPTSWTAGARERGQRLHPKTDKTPKHTRTSRFLRQRKFFLLTCEDMKLRTQTMVQSVSAVLMTNYQCLLRVHSLQLNTVCQHTHTPPL